MSQRTLGRSIWVSVRAMLVFTLVLGVGYTLVITAIGQLVFPAKANGSTLADASGQIIGSSLIGQSLTDADGNPLPQYFQSRPSAAGDGYDPTASSGSNLGTENSDLISSIQDRIAQVAAFNGVDAAEVPADAVTASGSGLDPDISPAYAAIQASRVAQARGLSLAQVQALIAQYTEGRQLGFLGEPTVNVLELNQALDQLKG